MDKYEYKVRANEIKELIDRQEYVQAAEIADTIDWRRVKSVMMLCMISDLYKINRRYEDARDMLLLAYERRPGGRTICYSLCELSIKMEEYVQAIEYYKEYVQAAGSTKDAGRFILQYKLYESQDVSLEERIAVLEKLKQCEYREKWGYELAYLYHRVGLASRCVEECDELILWFGDGKYVIKAMELKMLHQPLTPEQQLKYDHRFDSADVQAMPAEAQTAEAESIRNAEYVQEPSITSDTQVYQGVQETPIAQPEELDIHVKTMDVGQYNTINLQAELAEGLREVLAEESSKAKIANPITRSIVAPMMESDTESLDYPEIAEASEEDLEPVAEEIESSEVFFGETGEIGDLQEIPSFVAEAAPVVEANNSIVQEPGITELTVPEAAEEVSDSAEVVSEQEEEKAETTAEVTVPDITAEIVMEQLRQENIAGTAEPEEVKVVHAEPPKSLAHVLSQESDGQISLVMPEKENIEKQITGQISLTDILIEWERMKKENQEKRQEEVRQHVLQQTGTMFTEFEAAVRDGLLEKLESGKDVDNIELEIAEAISITEEAVAEEGLTEVDEEDVAEEVFEETEEIAEAEEIFEETEEIAGAEETFGETEEIPEAEETFGETEEMAEAEEIFEETEEIAETEEVFGEIEEIAEAEETFEEIEEMVEVEEVFEETEKIVETEECFAENTEILEESLTEMDEVEELAEIEESTGEYFEEDTEAVVAEETEAVAEAASFGEAVPEEVQEEAPIVERDKAKVRALTREEKELYAPFIQSRSAKEKLVNAIDNISLAAYTGNLIITGEEGMDTLTLAKNMIREIQANDSNFSGKVAKISGQAFNKKDVAATLAQLENGALIIAKASGMNGDTVNVLYKSLQQENMGIVIVLEDTKRAIDKLLATYEQLKNSFTARMDVEALSNDMLVAFGKQYAREREYSIDELGMLALHTRIEDLQTIDHVVTVVEVKEIVDEAIDHANRKTIGHFFDILFAKRYDEEDMIILSEKDFV